MIYTKILLLFGILPISLMWITWSKLIRRHMRSLLVIVILIMMVSIPWEIISVNRIWYYSPEAILGPRILGLPIEELAFFIIDGLLVGTLTIILRDKLR